ncbi:MAG: RNA polymerase subunit sigma [Planctomycetes bacterium]|jgi:RNA polymerase sigma factor (TIGR02999 family)|nr:RNA polymerase subunit sigma [Planctomycetota bacterium]
MTGSGAKDASVTEALRATSLGELDAADRLLGLVYQDLRRLAKSKMARLGPGQTLQTTALVHEAWMRVSKSDSSDWQNRAHFFGAAARAMRNILVDQARRKRSSRFDGEIDEAIEPAIEPPTDNILALDEALEDLEAIESRKAQVVMLRFFAGLSMAAIAKVLDVSLSTVENDWRFARAWLQRRVESAKGCG